MNKVKELLNFRPFNRENILKLVCLLSVLFLVLMVIISYISIKTNPNVSLSIMGGKLFSDFAETLSYCIIDNPYRNDFGINSIYPPFAYLIFYPFALICKSPLEGIVNGTISLTEIKCYPYFVISYLLYLLPSLSLLLFLIHLDAETLSSERLPQSKYQSNLHHIVYVEFAAMFRKF